MLRESKVKNPLLDLLESPEPITMKKIVDTLISYPKEKKSEWLDEIVTCPNPSAIPVTNTIASHFHRMFQMQNPSGSQGPFTESMFIQALMELGTNPYRTTYWRSVPLFEAAYSKHQAAKAAMEANSPAIHPRSSQRAHIVAASALGKMCFFQLAENHHVCATVAMPKEEGSRKFNEEDSRITKDTVIKTMPNK